MLENYFKGLYKRTMEKAYHVSLMEIVNALESGGDCLNCGANEGRIYDMITTKMELGIERFYGIEWNADCVIKARNKGLNVINGDLNKELPYDDNKFRCVFALSVLEHLLNPCKYLKECKRVLQDTGVLVILTPNISTYFTAFLILIGRMPSSGPHPDSNELVRNGGVYQISSSSFIADPESDNPVHRHLIVFSFRVLRNYLNLLGFKDIKGYGFGLYPFPNFMQSILERLDPYHCHQLVFIARK